jgi:biofilm PGA synthesis N-glycosyltransferase PgaC
MTSMRTVTPDLPETPETRPLQYVLISPVKDEERYIELTLRSVICQTIRPALWIIVDDGSTDATTQIIRRYQDAHPFIRLLDHKLPGPRHPGSRVIHAFNRGYAALNGVSYDFIVKLDCDLSFEPDHFERLFARFAADPNLGIASGIYLEQGRDESWQPVAMPSYHAFGACKVVRRRCYEDIDGFLTVPGWDTVDEIRAWSAGWATRHFTDIQTHHHKPEGSGIGRVRTSRMHGEIYYRTGGDPLFLLFKILHRLTTPPFLTGALALVSGYLGALFTRQPLLVTPPQAQAYRRLLRRRLLGRSANLDPLPGVRS